MILGQCSSVVRGTLVIYRAAPSRIISFYPGGNAFIRGELEALLSSEFARFPRYTPRFLLSRRREKRMFRLKYRRGSLSLSRNSLLSGFRCSFETDLPPPPPPPLTVVSRTRLITTSDDEPGFELFHGRFSNCETPTRYQATTDSSNSVIRTEAVRGGLSLRCHARKRKNARSYKIVNHSADPPLFRETSLLLSLPSRGSNPLMIRGSEKRRKGDSSRTSCVTRKRIVKRDNLSMRGDGILV